MKKSNQSTVEPVVEPVVVEPQHVAAPAVSAEDAAWMDEVVAKFSPTPAPEEELDAKPAKQGPKSGVMISKSLLARVRVKSAQTGVPIRILVERAIEASLVE